MVLMYLLSVFVGLVILHIDVYGKHRTMKFSVTICIIACSCLAFAASAEKHTAGLSEFLDSTEIAVDIYYEIIPTSKYLRSRRSKTLEMKLTVNLPQTIKGKQEVTKLEFDPTPIRVFIENGNKYAEYVLSVPKEKTRIKIQIEAKVFRYDLATVMKPQNQNSLSHANLEPFLQHERMIEKDDAVIQDIVRTIKGQTELKIVKNIYRYVIGNLTMDPSRLKGVGAAKTAQIKKGMCIDYCDLFVALCRAKNIPARVVAGYKTHFNVSPKHSWVEVHFKEYGWVPFDVTVNKNMPEDVLNWKFYNLGARYLYFTSLRSDPVLHNNYYYFYPYWDKGFRRHIQQVIETIEFKKPLHQTHDSRKDTERARKAGHIK